MYEVRYVWVNDGVFVSFYERHVRIWSCINEQRAAKRPPLSFSARLPYNYTEILSLQISLARTTSKRSCREFQNLRQGYFLKASGLAQASSLSSVFAEATSAFLML